MRILKFNTLKLSAVAAVASLALSTASSLAIPTSITFTNSVGTQPGTVGTITLTQVNANTVNVLIDLLAGYGFINTGGPHTPFAFQILGAETGVSASFITPPGGMYVTPGPTTNFFSLNLLGGDNTPYGKASAGNGYGIAIDSSAPNGSGDGYFGDLSFDLTRTSGLLVTDFTTNGLGYYFSADLSNGQNTGAQAWNTPIITNDIPRVPDGGTTVMLLGAGLAGLGMMTLRFKK